MNDVIAVMLDVSGLVVRGSDAARIEARRLAEARERSAQANAQSAAVPRAAARRPEPFLRWLPRAWLHLS